MSVVASLTNTERPSRLGSGLTARTETHHMTEKNLDLYIASYPDTTSAQEDFDALKVARDAGDVKILASAIIDRDDEGKVDVKEHVAHSGLKAAGWGALGGLLVGLFAPEVLVVTAAGTAIATTALGTEVAAGLAGAGVGGLIHEIRKHHEEKKLAKDLDEYLPTGSSAILALVDDEVADRIDKILARATKRVARAIDHDDYDKLVKALSEAGYEIDDELANA